METSKTYDQGHNDFSDKSYKEINETRTGLKVPSERGETNGKSMRQRRSLYKDTNLPNAVNHTKYMQPIKDQKGKRFIN